MHVTRAGEYGIFGILHLARQPEGRVVMIEEISNATGVPQSYLAKIFQSLHKSGIVQSHRGATGGFTLAKQPREILVLDIIESVEGPVIFQSCLADAPECIISQSLPADCTVRNLLAHAQKKFIEVLANTTIEDLKQNRLTSAVER
jgi:Rrf2 family iron-sulfur cluster assembly transcriptional regulator